MTKEQIEGRLKDLETQRSIAFRALEQAKMQVAAVDGALQECQYWLSRINEAPQETSKDTPPNT